MKKAPNLYTIDDIFVYCEHHSTLIDNVWVPARPIGYFILKYRLKLAIGVFLGKYDALKWPCDQ
jgi:hypothetical protein